MRSAGWVRYVLTAGAATVTLFAAASGPASAHGPVPTCSWTPAAYVGGLVKDAVRLSQPDPYNGTTLFCQYYELHRKLSLEGQETWLVQVQYGTFGSFQIPSGATPVAGLGDCSKGCPGNRPAWLLVIRGYPDTGKPSKTKIVTSEILDVQDGSNDVSIGINTPLGSLPGDETADIEAIARKVLPSFYDNV
jgi:hypothetical protein